MPRSRKGLAEVSHSEGNPPERGADARRDAYAVPALDKAVEVLDLLASSSDGLSMAEIVTRSGRSMGELYRLVVALERHNLIERDAERERYALSLRLFEMAHRHPPTDRLIKH